MSSPFNGKFNFNIQFLDGKTGWARGWTGQLMERDFSALEFLIGRGVGTLVKEPFNQVIDWQTARGFMLLVGQRAQALQAEEEPGVGIWRITIA